MVPGGESELGKKVASLQRKLDSIQMDIITYGIIYHPHLSESGCQIPGATQRSMRGKQLIMISSVYFNFNKIQ